MGIEWIIDCLVKIPLRAHSPARFVRLGQSWLAKDPCELIIVQGRRIVVDNVVIFIGALIVAQLTSALAWPVCHASLFSPLKIAGNYDRLSCRQYQTIALLSSFSHLITPGIKFAGAASGLNRSSKSPSLVHATTDR